MGEILEDKKITSFVRYPIHLFTLQKYVGVVDNFYDVMMGNHPYSGQDDICYCHGELDEDRIAKKRAEKVKLGKGADAFGVSAGLHEGKRGHLLVIDIDGVDWQACNLDKLEVVPFIENYFGLSAGDGERYYVDSGHGIHAIFSINPHKSNFYLRSSLHMERYEIACGTLNHHLEKSGVSWLPTEGKKARGCDLSAFSKAKKFRAPHCINSGGGSKTREATKLLWYDKKSYVDDGTGSLVGIPCKTVYDYIRGIELKPVKKKIVTDNTGNKIATTVLSNRELRMLNMTFNIKSGDGRNINQYLDAQVAVGGVDPILEKVCMLTNQDYPSGDNINNEYADLYCFNCGETQESSSSRSMSYYFARKLFVDHHKEQQRNWVTSGKEALLNLARNVLHNRAAGREDNHAVDSADITADALSGGVKPDQVRDLLKEIIRTDRDRSFNDKIITRIARFVVRTHGLRSYHKKTKMFYSKIRDCYLDLDSIKVVPIDTPAQKIVAMEDEINRVMGYTSPLEDSRFQINDLYDVFNAKSMMLQIADCMRKWFAKKNPYDIKISATCAPYVQLLQGLLNARISVQEGSAYGLRNPTLFDIIDIDSKGYVGATDEESKGWHRIGVDSLLLWWKNCKDKSTDIACSWNLLTSLSNDYKDYTYSIEHFIDLLHKFELGGSVKLVDISKGNNKSTDFDVPTNCSNELFTCNIRNIMAYSRAN